MCGACVTACSVAYFKADDLKSSRIQIEEVTGMPKIRVCDQCGACIAVCPTRALRRDPNGVVRLHGNKCTGCLMCVGFCDSGYMFFNAARQPEPFKCTACGLCVKACKYDALILMQNQGKAD